MDPFEYMLMMLQSNQLQVVLVPSKRNDARDWDMIRCAISKNAPWYSKFCNNHASSRRRRKTAFDTKIKRANTVRALENILAGKPAGIYEDELRRIARGIQIK